MTNHFDIIGDIHGHAGKLLKLLLKLDYRNLKGCFRHKERKAIFLGDLIDRGKENFKTLEIVKAMVDKGQALIIMGNHEYNALCYHSKDNKGNYLRKHNEKNFNQHKEVLAEIAARGEMGKKEWQDYLEWFAGMPLFLDIPGIRVVHACWDQDAVDFIKGTTPPPVCVRTRTGRPYKNGSLAKDFLIKSSRKGTDTFEAVDILLKGKEIDLPGDFPGILDKDGHLRKRVRVKWWLPREQWENVETYDQVSRINKESLKVLSGIKVPAGILEKIRTGINKEKEDNTPIFFGHYWFNGEPRPLTKNAVCLDYSVGRGGKLACYRWDGEAFLHKSKFIWT